MTQSVSDPKMQLIKNEVKRASKTMQRLRPDRQFTDIELALGYNAFISWLSLYLDMEPGSDEAYVHAAGCNDSARASAIKLMRNVLEHDSSRTALMRKVPDIEPVKELRLLEEVQYGFGNIYWDNCTSRAVIMICRQMAYNFTGVLGETDFQLDDLSWTELFTASFEWSHEALFD